MTRLSLPVYLTGYPIRRYSSGRGVQRGVSLIVVLLILVAVTLLGVGAVQISIMGERGARNDRDIQVAWQSAEAALIDAEAEMIDPASTRRNLFDGKAQTGFTAGCGTGATAMGLCEAVATGTKPAWLLVDFTSTNSSATTVALGQFTGRSYQAAGLGIQPAQMPRYVIELIPDPLGDASDPSYVYRVTGMGFGPRPQIQAVIQMVYRI